MGIWYSVCLENRDLFKRWQSWLELISEQNKLLRNWGHVLTPFFDTCQGRWFRWRKGGRFGRNQKMHGWRRETYLWNLGDGRHCWREWSMDLNLRNPRELRWRRRNRCILKQERRWRCYRECASGEEDRDIYNSCPRAEWEFDTLFVWKTVIRLNVGNHDRS